MINIRNVLAATLVVGLAVANQESADAQEFSNLNFEQVVLNGTPTLETIFTSVVSVPGWTFSHNNPPQLAAHLGGYPQQFLANNLFRPDWILEGQYSLYLEEGLAPDLMTSVGPWVEQTGLVPAGAQSLRFPDSHGPFRPGFHPWIVSLNGTVLPTAILPGDILSSDLTGFAGQVGALRIALDPTFSDSILGAENSVGVLDSIRFSPLAYTVAPEPASGALALMVISAAAVVRRRRGA